MAKLSSYQNILLQKVKNRPDFVGYYLLKHLEEVDISEEDFLKDLACTEEGFIKLALCRLAPPLSPDFAESINKISKYVQVDDLFLSQMIKKIAISEKMEKGQIVGMPSKRNLMAAREKEQKEKRKDGDETME